MTRLHDGAVCARCGRIVTRLTVCRDRDCPVGICSGGDRRGTGDAPRPTPREEPLPGDMTRASAMVRNDLGGAIARGFDDEMTR